MREGQVLREFFRVTLMVKDEEGGETRVRVKVRVTVVMRLLWSYYKIEMIRGASHVVEIWPRNVQ